MIKNIKIKAKKGKAVRIECSFTGSTEQYALAWLHLSNNAREYPNIFLKYWNNPYDSVFVVTPEKYADKMKSYLTSLTKYEVADTTLNRIFTVKIEDEEVIETITPLVDWEATYEDEADDDAEVLPWCDL